MTNSRPRLWHRLFGKRQADTLPIIVVSGLPRSGTSLMMHMLVVGGIEVLTDDVRQADTDNPKGYFASLHLNWTSRDWHVCFALLSLSVGQQQRVCPNLVWFGLDQMAAVVDPALYRNRALGAAECNHRTDVSCCFEVLRVYNDSRDTLFTQR